ncbi:GNAT family N-acetyltransferase [Aliikangiella marina]|uniref:GNAT family N-acetyltransferase n=1 Tax=Aliikangiella marina TaxID=1712262 RepID=A0A545T4P1_9GAMM|nr:GNAT family N-acetyltransferase [Aliikangiella marina]TQV72183.1 GNAT family N-acetyltransferase [Aliikangiella marina]
MDYLIRQATTDDAGAIAEFIHPIVKQFISHEFAQPSEQLMLGSLTASAIAGNIDSNYRYRISINQNNDIVGVLGVRLPSHLFHLFVEPSLHGRGIGRALWQDYLQQTTERQFTLNSSKIAVGFYEKLGFEKQGSAIEKNGILSYPMRLEL